MSYDSELRKETRLTVKWSTIAFLTIVGTICLSMYGCPKYNVYSSEMNGKAQYMEAQQNRLIQIEEAKANLEAQKLNAQSEI